MMLLRAFMTAAALCVPTCTIAYFATRVWDRFRDARWRIATEAGVVPVVIGFVAASALLLGGLTVFLPALLAAAQDATPPAGDDGLYAEPIIAGYGISRGTQQAEAA